MTVQRGREVVTREVIYSYNVLVSNYFEQINVSFFVRDDVRAVTSGTNIYEFTTFLKIVVKFMLGSYYFHVFFFDLIKLRATLFRINYITFHLLHHDKLHIFQDINTFSVITM